MSVIDSTENIPNNRIAIINSVIDFGSTGLLARKLYEYGKMHGYKPFVFFGRNKKKGKEEDFYCIDSKLELYCHKLLTLITGFQGRYSFFATKKLIRRLDNMKIKKVILLNLHGYYLNEKRLLKYLKDNKVETAYITPDEYPGMGKCCYSKECNKYKSKCTKCPYVKDYPKSLFWDRSEEIFNMKKELYSGFNTITFLGPESNLIKFRQSALIKDKPMRRVDWGIDLDVYKNIEDNSIYRTYNIPRDKIIILTVAKYSDSRKGVKEYFFELAKRFQGTNYHFINVGYDGNLKEKDIPTNMTLIGYIDNQTTLSSLYSIADLYLLASKSDTMPLSCLIAFACETPVACFYTSGLMHLAPKGTKAVKYAEDVSLEAFERIISNTQKKDETVRKICRNLASNEYSIDLFCNKVFDVFER